eukprot:symbB.v1.2.013277.t1/scaffold879.1/size325971/24
MKFLLLGDTGVGKSSLLLRFADGIFVQNYLCTIGVDFRIRRLTLDGMIIKLHVWDMAGQLRYGVCNPSFRAIRGGVIVFDITDRESFNNVIHWAEEMQKKTNQEDLCVMLMGNKADLEQQRAKEFAMQFDMLYMETSAKSKHNVEEAFVALAKAVKRRVRVDLPTIYVNNAVTQKGKTIGQWTQWTACGPHARILWEQELAVEKLFAQGLVQEEIRQQLGFDIDLGMVNEHEMQEWLDWIVEEAAISLLDVDGDGTITIEDFCTLGTELKGQAEHFVDLAQSFSEAILDSSSGCPRYGAFYVVAAPRTKDSFDPPADAVIFANTSSKHSAAAALTNARLARLKKGKTVAVKVHLFPQTKDEQMTLESFAALRLAVYITFCVSFIPAGITHYLVKERTSGARQLQALSGASHFSYWLSNMIYDVALYVLPALSVPVALEVFGYHTLLKGDSGQALFAVLAAFGPAIAGFSYVVSFIFKDHSRASTIASNTILTFCLVGAIVLSTVLFVLTIINYDPTAQYPTACDYPTEGNCRSPGARIAERILSPLFRMVPTVCIYQALFAIAIVANLKAVVPEGALDALNAVGGEGVHRVNLHPFSFEWAGAML